MPVARQSVDKCGEYAGKLRIFRWRSAQQFQLLAFGCQRLSVADMRIIVIIQSERKELQ